MFVSWVTFPNVYQLRLLCGLLQVSWEFCWYVFHTYFFVGYILFAFLCPPYSLLISFKMFSLFFLIYSGDTQDQRCFSTLTKSSKQLHQWMQCKTLCSLSPNWAGDPTISFGPFICCGNIGKSCGCPTYMPLPFFLCSFQLTSNCDTWPCAWRLPPDAEPTWSRSGAGNEYPPLSFPLGAAPNQWLKGASEWLKNSLPLLLWQHNCEVRVLHRLPGSLPLKGGSSSCHTFIGCLPFLV